MELYVPDGTSSTDRESALVDAISALSRVLVGVTARTLAGLDVEVTLPQYRTLVLLASRGPLRTVDLAAALDVHPSTVTRTCDRLVRRGLVGRHQGTVDRRVVWLGLTEEGRDLVGTVMRRRGEHVLDLVRAAGVTADDATLELIDVLVTASGEPTEQEWWRHWDRCGDVENARAAGGS
ncbi:MarR family winged helix-turn-helix transcriptional regulator [Micromonospora sp. MS34]|uniref:MarR family winged helix-turn-helix transcriptional regulator n=1 Tax=Micromonospora sp. MS34 TaxID=3385971 RepID=UPI00399FE7E2